MSKMFKTHRIDPSAIDASLKTFLESCHSVIVLHDGCLTAEFNAELNEYLPQKTIHLDVRHSSTAALEGTATDTGIVYACLQDDLGLPFVNLAYAQRLRVHPIFFAAPRDYLSRNSRALSSLKDEIERQREKGYLKVDFGYGDFANLIQAHEATKERPGCFVEVGCFCGSSAGALLSYVASRQEERGHPKLSYHFLDVFDGFDYTEAKDSCDVFWAGTHQTDGLDAVRNRIVGYGRTNPELNIEVHRCNIISDPIPEEIIRSGVRLANIDVDLYEAVAAGLARIAPLIVPGGIMICEDAGHTPLLIGALKALEEFVRTEEGRRFCRIDMASGQTFLIRTE